MASDWRMLAGGRGQSSGESSRPSAQRRSTGECTPCAGVLHTNLLPLSARLKDSDVTWLYGPLHEHAEPVPPPKIASAQDRLDLDDSVRTKSILKHRTISEMLTTPGRSASPIFEFPGGIGSGEASREASDGEDSDRGGRPSFFPVKSDSNLAARKRKAGGSPPASEKLFQNLINADKEDGILQPPAEEKRHISFNQRVDQCIAVDVEEDDEEDEEEEEEEEEEEDIENGETYSDYDGRKRDDEDEDTPSSDEEVLTMRSSPRTSTAWPLTTNAASSQNSLNSFEHQTIAKLAPTMLKTSDTYPAPSPQVVDPSGFTENTSGNRAGQASQPTLSSQPQVYQYGTQHQDDEGLSQTRYSQWDADDDFNGDFDYFNGPDMADNYESPHPQETSVPKDEVASKHASIGSENGSEEQTTVEATSAPRSILKKRNAHVVSNEEGEVSRSVDEGAEVASPPAIGSPTMPSSEERGRPSQRLGSSASYERLQDANRGAGNVSTAGSVDGRTRSNSNNGGVSSSPASSFEGAVGNNTSTSNTSSTYSSTYGHKPSERRDSFRGRAGDGSKAMGSAQSGSYAAAAATAGTAVPKRSRGTGSSSSVAVDSDSDGRGSFDFNGSGYPASPQQGNKNDQEFDGSEAQLHGQGKGKGTTNAKGAGQGKRAPQPTTGGQGQDNEQEEQPARLSVDLDNLPSNTSPTTSAQGGPTPLNTPTFALAKSRASRQTKSASAASSAGKGPDSPTLPRRSSATGALVAPSDADKDAGVRVPLAHDYVEEDEGGIVGRAVEIVNTARDLIGALLGTGGDRGRSWRESY